ncbi:MAG: 30S ribosomal protein S5 [Candidatus Kerfeldbacteria bacterium]|nr:30S ribosomal protein S5 [Candidatus Kerfeldbacteria bacterium]
MSPERRSPSRSRRSGKPQGQQDEFDQKVLDIARVTRVMAGGKRMRFRACVVIGDRKGKIGFGVAKGADVSTAIAKSVSHAKKHLQKVPVYEGTIPHESWSKFHAAKVLLRPARQGTGVIAGATVRAVVELAGIKNIVSKVMGSKNVVNNVHATFDALTSMRPRPPRKQGGTV